MKKDEFKKAVAEKLNIKQVEAEKVIAGVFETVEDALVEGKKVPLGGLGKLGTVEKAARKGRNPQDGSEIQIEAKTAPKFKASEHLKELVK
ncbi:hypothetical protein CIL05_06905 [Virgibacillus profundi]|uniref:DNA-binding protein n=2 Tax=Virgibacillus profundi TaxID=2024555 RepID=A0A2A2IH06_9BACI|nr:hypothetical protein CIL05_06905 [Virgibacillus profundi]PXY54612.1 HU family DNA-binding protein [Virgibacillus profundi]